MLWDIIKKYTGNRLNNLAKKLCSYGLTANKATILSFIFTIITGILFLQGELFLGGIVFLIDHLFDFLDGFIARATGTSTSLGCFLDRITDAFRRFLWLALALSGLLPFNLAILGLIVDSIGFLIPQMIILTKVKSIKWLPVWTEWFIIPGAILGQIVFFTWAMVIIGGILILVNVFSIIFLNFPKSNK